MPFFITFFLNSSRHFPLHPKIMVSVILFLETLLVSIPCSPLKKGPFMGLCGSSPASASFPVSVSVWRRTSTLGMCLRFQALLMWRETRGAYGAGHLSCPLCPRVEVGTRHFHETFPREKDASTVSEEGGRQQRASLEIQRISTLIV